MELNQITGVIITEAIHLHNDLGPGLLESVYENLLTYRLRKRGLSVQRQRTIPLTYEGTRIDVELRADLIIENAVIAEIKSVESLLPVHAKQLLTYMKLSGITVGLLINFNEAILKNGIKRLVNNYSSASSATQRDP